MLTDFQNRILADQRDPDAWHAARKNRLGGSDAASFAKRTSIEKYGRAKLLPGWEGGLFSQWGHQREPVILLDHGFEQNHFLIASQYNDRFAATPDGIDSERGILAQVKTSMHDLRFKDGVPQVTPAHRRQMLWEQFVMGPDYRLTHYIHEHYTVNAAGDPVPAFEATVVEVERDDEAILELVAIATEVLRFLDDARSDF